MMNSIDKDRFVFLFISLGFINIVVTYSVELKAKTAERTETMVTQRLQDYMAMALIKNNNISLNLMTRFNLLSFSKSIEL